MNNNIQIESSNSNVEPYNDNNGKSCVVFDIFQAVEKNVSYGIRFSDVIDADWIICFGIGCFDVFEINGCTFNENEHFAMKLKLAQESNLKTRTETRNGNISLLTSSAEKINRAQQS